jgi:hypothetical protein
MHDDTATSPDQEPIGWGHLGETQVPSDDGDPSATVEPPIAQGTAPARQKGTERPDGGHV